MANDPLLEGELKAFFDEFVEAYPKEDLARYLNLFSQDEDFVMFGTADRWLGWEEYKDAPAEEKARFDDISLSYDWLKINSHGDVAWIAAEVHISFKFGAENMIVPARLTGVAKKTEGKWKIVQGHISIASG